VVLVVINLILVAYWFWGVAIRDYISAGRIKSSRLWSFFCFRHRARRVRPRNRLSSWSIDESEELTNPELPLHRTHDAGHGHSHSLSESYFSPTSLTDHRKPDYSIFRKLWNGVQLLNPFRKRPVAVKSMPPKAGFQIVDGNRPPSEEHSPDHVRLASATTLASSTTDSSSFGNFPNSPRRFAHGGSGSRETIWGGSWKGVFKSNVSSISSRLRNAFTRTNDVEFNPPVSHDIAGYPPFEDTLHPRDRGSETKVNVSPNRRNGRPARDREGYSSISRNRAESYGIRDGDDDGGDSVLLISRVPGVDFSVRSNQSLRNTAMAESSPASPSSAHPHPYLNAGPQLSQHPNSSIDSLAEYDDPTHDQDSLNDASMQPLLYAEEYANFGFAPPQHNDYVGTPSAHTFASSSLEEPLSRAAIERILRPSRSNPTLLFPGAVRAAGYTGVSDRYSAHRRNMSFQVPGSGGAASG
jgi:hypothetical protein